MAARTSNTFWNILYALIVIVLIIVLLPLFGVSISAGILNFLYILLVVLVILAVVHWVGLI